MTIEPGPIPGGERPPARAARFSAARLMVGVAIALAAALSVLVAREGRWSQSYRVAAFRQKGSASARVVLTEFSDFQCGSCAGSQPYLHEFLAKHADDVRLIYRHHPFKMHKWAALAANAADCAGAQGKFWEYHDLLFTKQADWSNAADAKPIFLEYARTVGVNLARFEKDLDADRWKGLLQDDTVEGLVRGVTATPTFFLGDRKMVGEGQFRAYGEKYLELEKGS